MKQIIFAFFLFLFIKTHAQVNLSSSLSACYALNGNGAEPINNLSGTLSAVTATLDRFSAASSALYFSGSNSSYISLPNSPLIRPLNGISFSAWVKPSLLAGQMVVVFTKNTSGSFFTAYGLTIENIGTGYVFRANRQNGSSNDIVNASTLLSLNTWYHVAFAMDNTTFKIYVNGVLEGNVSPFITSFAYDATRGVILGGTNEGAYNAPFFGSMDNVRFYNRIITAAEVSALYSTDPSCLAGPPPVASFSVSPASICQGSSINLSDLSTNTPTAWAWQIQGASSASASVANPTVNLNNPGTYTISLVSTNVGGASNTATQSIVVLPNPVLSITGNSLVCSGQASTLSASGAASYTWSGNQTGAILSINLTSNTTYSVVGTGTNGCVGFAQTSISVAALPLVTLSGNNSLCQNSSLTLQAGGTAISYLWNTGATAQSISVSPLTTSIYTVTGTDANGCKSSATKNITVFSLPLLTVSGNSVICQGASTSLLVNGTAVSYTWSNGTVGNLITVSPVVSTIYTVTGSDVNGCSNSTVQPVLVNSAPAVIANVNISSACLGDAVILTGSGANTYTWSGGVSDNIPFFPSTSATYTVTGTGSNACKNTATISIAVNPLPVLVPVTNTLFTVCKGDVISLAISGANIYSWSSGEITSAISASPVVTGNYTVTGTDANGCKASFVFKTIVNDCVGLTVNELNADFEVFPNPASKELMLRSKNQSARFDVEIYNVLGEKITQTVMSGDVLTINLSAESNGIYFIRLYHSGSFLQQLKVIKVDE